jgi:alpha-mannosidase
MIVALRERERRNGTVLLAGTLPATAAPVLLRYRTRTGALARVGAQAAGAFDREHREIVVGPAPAEREITLEVELHSLPTNFLPSGPGLHWWWINRFASETPRAALRMEPYRLEPAAARSGPVPLWGHSHLDVAWLWTYGETKRKATRTFANALALLDEDESFVFIQSQPQLYEFVREQDEALFERVKARAAQGRFDADVAAMWVECDCNLPSGESLLRQTLAANRYCRERLGVEPSIAWLPDSFGFARTLPTLLAHAGIGRFATTKLKWNDTTHWPHPRFRWRGPDGAEILAAMIDGMDRGCDPRSIRTARRRAEPLIVGYGDGGGGPTRRQLAAARRAGRWERPRAFFERLADTRETLPLHDDELYLEYHRGVYTTHRDVKAHNAALERALELAEEQAAWCVAVGAPAGRIAPVREALAQAWRIVLRNQFHDVLPGSVIASVYEEARAEYERAHRLVEAALAQTQAMLPRTARAAQPELCAPVAGDGGFRFENASLSARVLPSGALAELVPSGGTSAIAQANLLALYRDRPSRWEAWNIDAGYERTQCPARPQAARIAGGGLEIPFLIGSSPAVMRISLHAREAFLRVELAVDWRERRRLLRVENWLAVETDSVTYGAPHGVVTRCARADTPALRARFEVPGQRFAAACNARGDGIALLALDTYGWSARALARGGLRLGHSLLRSPYWPDPDADRGEQQLAWAFAPLRGSSTGRIERLWRQYAGMHAVRLFEPDDEAILVVACKPAEDGAGVIVRVRECDGRPRPLRLRCGARMRGAAPVDALERPVPGAARIEAEYLAGDDVPAFGLRSFRVNF